MLSCAASKPPARNPCLLTPAQLQLHFHLPPRRHNRSCKCTRSGNKRTPSMLLCVCVRSRLLHRTPAHTTISHGRGKCTARSAAAVKAAAPPASNSPHCPSTPHNHHPTRKRKQCCPMGLKQTHNSACGDTVLWPELYNATLHTGDTASSPSDHTQGKSSTLRNSIILATKQCPKGASGWLAPCTICWSLRQHTPAHQHKAGHRPQSRTAQQPHRSDTSVQLTTMQKAAAQPLTKSRSQLTKHASSLEVGG